MIRQRKTKKKMFVLYLFILYTHCTQISKIRVEKVKKQSRVLHNPG